MIITRLSPVSGKVQSLDLDVTEEQMKIFRSSESYVSDIFPNLSPDQIEFIKTGIYPGELDQASESE